MRRGVPAAIVLVALITATGVSAHQAGAIRTAGSPIHWQHSLAVGEPFDGRLIRGVQLPPSGKDWLTWDPILDRSPNRGWRRWGTDHLLRVTFRVIREFRAAHTLAPRVLIGDLSRRHGGDFGPRFGGIGHASHQNGLDIDIYYPRRDRRERPPRRPGQVDLRLAQALVNGFVQAGAQYVFVGPSLPLRGPRRVVQPLVHHDNHLHARLYNPARE
jgi:murein endopeptidase